jgi:hypothetical protein
MRVPAIWPVWHRIDASARQCLPAQVRLREVGPVQAFEDIGITELYFDPTTASLEQVDRLADLLL